MSNTVPSEYYWRTRNADTNHQSIISGQEDHQSRTQCHQNTLAGAQCRHQSSEYYQRAGGPPTWNTVPSEYYQRAGDNQRGTQCHQNTISGRKDRGPPRLGLTKLLTSGRRGFIYARQRCTPVASQTGWPRILPRVPKVANYEQLPGLMLPLSKTLLQEDLVH